MTPIDILEGIAAALAAAILTALAILTAPHVRGASQQIRSRRTR